MNRFAALLFLFGFITFFKTGYILGSETDLERFLLHIKEKSEEVSSLHANITQEKKLALFKKPIIFTGKISLDRPDKLRWEFISPVPSVLIFNQTKGMKCELGSKPQHFDLQSDPIMQIVAKQLWTWLDGDFTKLKNDYSLHLIDPQTIKIKPNDISMKKIIEWVSILFDNQSGQPLNIVIVEPGGDSTNIHFSNHQLKPHFSEKEFSQCFDSEN